MSQSQSQAATSAHGHGHDHHEISIKKYVMVFVALIIGTAITVGAYFFQISSVALTVTLAMCIASVKAFLVAGWFMHLMDEKKMIYGILASTAFFFVSLMFLTIWAMNDAPTMTTYFLPGGH